MAREDVCYTWEVALEKAIEMEAKGFEAYKEAYLKASTCKIIESRKHAYSR